MEVNEIMKRAIAMGACEKSGKATDWKSLAWLFFSPQGREFCAEHNYPSLCTFRGMKGKVEDYGVHIEENLESENADIALIGPSESVLNFTSTDKPYRVILMHGAKATIHARMYSVVRVENISGDYEVFNDGTATII